MIRTSSIHLRAGRWIVTMQLALAVCMPVRGQHRTLPESVQESVSEAIRNKVGGVFVVRIQRTFQMRSSRVFRHVYAVEEVLKPYRNNDGIYWIPFEANERTSDRRPALEIGKRYLIATKLRFGGYGWLYVEDKMELGPGDAELIHQLREMVQVDAAYGSSRLLNNTLSNPFGFDSGGLRSPHRDGRVDPAAFGLTRDVVQTAKREDDLDLLVVRYRHSRETADGGWERNVSIVEDLLQKGEEASQNIRFLDPETEEQWLDRAKKMAPPYKLSRFDVGYVYVFLIERRQEGLPLLRIAVPEIREDGPTVRTIRGWLEDKEVLDAKCFVEENRLP